MMKTSKNKIILTFEKQSPLRNFTSERLKLKQQNQMISMVMINTLQIFLVEIRKTQYYLLFYPLVSVTLPSKQFYLQLVRKFEKKIVTFNEAIN